MPMTSVATEDLSQPAEQQKARVRRAMGGAALGLGCHDDEGERR